MDSLRELTQKAEELKREIEGDFEFQERRRILRNEAFDRMLLERDEFEKEKWKIKMMVEDRAAEIEQEVRDEVGRRLMRPANEDLLQRAERITKEVKETFNLEVSQSKVQRKTDLKTNSNVGNSQRRMPKKASNVPQTTYKPSQRPKISGNSANNKVPMNRPVQTYAAKSKLQSGINPGVAKTPNKTLPKQNPLKKTPVQSKAKHSLSQPPNKEKNDSVPKTPTRDSKPKPKPFSFNNVKLESIKREDDQRSINRGRAIVHLTCHLLKGVDIQPEYPNRRTKICTPVVHLSTTTEEEDEVFEDDEDSFGKISLPVEPMTEMQKLSLSDKDDDDESVRKVIPEPSTSPLKQVDVLKIVVEEMKENESENEIHAENNEELNTGNNEDLQKAGPEILSSEGKAENDVVMEEVVKSEEEVKSYSDSFEEDESEEGEKNVRSLNSLLEAPLSTITEETAGKITSKDDETLNELSQSQESAVRVDIATETNPVFTEHAAVNTDAAAGRNTEDIGVNTKNPDSYDKAVQRFVNVKDSENQTTPRREESSSDSSSSASKLFELSATPSMSEISEGQVRVLPHHHLELSDGELSQLANEVLNFNHDNSTFDMDTTEETA